LGLERCPPIIVMQSGSCYEKKIVAVIVTAKTLLWSAWEQ